MSITLPLLPSSYPQSFSLPRCSPFLSYFIFPYSSSHLTPHPIPLSPCTHLRLPLFSSSTHAISLRLPPCLPKRSSLISPGTFSSPSGTSLSSFLHCSHSFLFLNFSLLFISHSFSSHLSFIVLIPSFFSFLPISHSFLFLIPQLFSSLLHCCHSTFPLISSFLHCFDFIFFLISSRSLLPSFISFLSILSQ